MKKGLILVMALCTALFVSCQKEQADPFAYVSFFLGNVLSNGQQVEIGTQLKDNDIIKTDVGSFCDISIGGSLIRVKEKTDVVTSVLMKNPDGSENIEVDLQLGKMLCKPKKLLKSEKFVVKTPTAVAGVRGTVFSVEADPNKTTRIKVFDGSTKVSKRVKQFDNLTDTMVSFGSVVETNNKVIITADDLQKSEQQVAQFLLANKDAGDVAFLEKAIEQNQTAVKVDGVVQRFAVDDYAKDKTDYIVLEFKKPQVRRVARVTPAVKLEDVNITGRLFVTKYEVYFVTAAGVIEWEGELSAEPIKVGNKLYVLSGDNVFCAQEAGGLSWRRTIVGGERIQLNKNRVFVYSGDEHFELAADSGKQLK